MAASPAIRNTRPTIFRNIVGTWCHRNTKLLVASAKADLSQNGYGLFLPLFPSSSLSRSPSLSLSLSLSLFLSSSLSLPLSLFLSHSFFSFFLTWM